MNLSKKIISLGIFNWLITTVLYVIAFKILFKTLDINVYPEKMKELVIFILIINAVIHTVMLIIIKRLIKNVLLSINNQINNINMSNRGRIHDQSKGKDEFSILIRDINNMFQSIEDKNKLIASNEKKYSKLVEGLDNGYAYFKILRDENGEVKDAFIVELNLSLANMIQKDRDSLMAGSFIKIFSNFIKDSDIVPKILRNVGGKHQSILRNSVRLGVDKWAYLTVYPIEDEYFAMIVTDISENRKFAEEMKHIANYDVLTGIQNRYCLYNYLDELKAKEEYFTIYYIDLDHFKLINDTLGHNVGDEVLCRTAETVQNLGGDNFSVARLGGDEFLGVRRGNYTIEETEQFGQEIIDALNAVESYNNHPYKIEASLGASRFLIDSDDIEELLKCGDIALYKSKKSGKNRIKVFDEDMKEEAMFQDMLESSLENGDLVPYYQPVYDVATEKVIGAEALIRWIKDGEVLKPDKFLAFAKESGGIVEIDNFVLREACKFCNEKRKEGHDLFHISINASSKFLLQNNFLSYLKKILKEFSIKENQLRFEITEDEVLEDIDNIIEILKQVKNLGIKIALDDFGVGYSSFNYIKLLPIDTIKIDRSLLLRVEEEKKTLAIISALIELAHTLDLDVIVEGVEIKEQIELLKSLNCDKIQGFYISEPVAKENFII